MFILKAMFYRLDKSIQLGSKVGMFLHFATNTLTFFLGGKQHGDPINFYSGSKTQNSIFYPAVSLNNGSQVRREFLDNCVFTKPYFFR